MQLLGYENNFQLSILAQIKGDACDVHNLHVTCRGLYSKIANYTFEIIRDMALFSFSSYILVTSKTKKKPFQNSHSHMFLLKKPPKTEMFSKLSYTHNMKSP